MERETKNAMVLSAKILASSIASIGALASLPFILSGLSQLYEKLVESLAVAQGVPGMIVGVLSVLVFWFVGITAFILRDKLKFPNAAAVVAIVVVAGIAHFPAADSLSPFVGNDYQEISQFTAFEWAARFVTALCLFSFGMACVAAFAAIITACTESNTAETN